METKKNPSADLRPKRGYFLNIGLCISISIALLAFEWKTAQINNIIIDGQDIIFGEEDIPEIPQILQPPPPPKIKNPVIEIVPNDIEIKDLPDFQIEVDPADKNPEVTIEIEPEKEIADETVDFSEVMPQPVGGMEAWNSFLSKNLKYPTQARRMGVEGTVYVSFVVNKLGQIEDVELVRGIGAGCDEEALRVILAAEDWLPGRNRGIPVKVKMRVPIRFRLQ